MKKNALLISLVFLLALSLVAIGCFSKPAGAAEKQKVFNWRFQALHSPGTPMYKYICEDEDGFLKMVERASAGRIKLKPFGLGVLMPPLQHFDAIGQGMIEIGWSWPVYWAGKIPAINLVTHLPYSVTGAKHSMNYLYYPPGEGAIDLLRKEYAKFNVYLVAAPGWVGIPIFSKKPIRTLDDFRGMKIRAVGILGNVLKKLGAAVVYIQVPEIYSALETGVIDAFSFGTIDTNISDMKLHEVTDYIIMPPSTACTPEEITVNMDAYNSLPDDLKAVIAICAELHINRFEQKTEYQDLVSLREAMKTGQIKEVITLSTSDQATLKKLSWETLVEAGKKDDLSAKMYQRLHDYMDLAGLLP